MGKKAFAIGTILVVILVAWLPCQADEIYGCAKRNNGQLRIVTGPGDCLPSEVSISWNGNSYLRIDPLRIYVNAQAGVDDPAHGLTAGEPFKTIGYALGRVPILRADPEVQTIINVAAGNYSEAISISINNIWLRGIAGMGSTFLIGNGNPGSKVVNIIGPVKSRITGFTITNGGYGVFVTSATLEIRDCDISNNNDYSGLFNGENSYVYVYNTKLHDNIRGIFTIRNSTTIIEGNSSIFNNSNMGIGVWYTSTARLRDSEVYSNNSVGIQAGGGSSLQIASSKVYDNQMGGINVTEMSSASFRGGNSIYYNAAGSSETWRGGVGAAHGSVVVFTLDGTNPQDQIYENSGPGLNIGNNSSLFMQYGLVKGNFGNGVTIGQGSRGQFENGSNIISNSGYGIACFGNSGMSKTLGATVSGNALGDIDINCQQP
jgi:hypothetical protein